MAQLVLLNGRVYTQDPNRPLAEAIVVDGERVLLVGTNEEARENAEEGSLTIDLKGRPVLPGLNDCHLHPLAYGRLLSSVNLTSPPNRSIQELLKNVRKWAEKTPAGEWIRGWGYDDTKLEERRHPNRFELDRAAPEHPVYLTRACGHIGVANSAALKAAGIAEHTPNPQGGQIERDASGRPTGVLRETAQALVRECMPELMPADVRKTLKLVGSELSRRGITSVWDAGVGRGSDVVAAYRELQATGQFPVRVNLAIGAALLPELAALALPPGFGDEWLRITAVKVMLDGSVSGHTAALQQPFCDSNDYGLLYMSQQELNDLILRIHKLGLQAAIHAIGDRAIDTALNACEFAQHQEQAGRRATPDFEVRVPKPALDELLPTLAAPYRVSPRHRIEHCSLTSRERIVRLRELGILPIPQPIFLYGEGDSYLQYLGADRSAQAYTLRSFLDHGIPVPLSTDAPATSWKDPLNPFLNIAMAVTRTTETGQLVGGKETISVLEAIRAYTLHAAFASFDEGRKGILRPGYLADIIVLNRDPDGVDPSELASLEVIMTIAGGEVVYQAE